MILSTICFVHLLIATFIRILEVILKNVAYDSICQNSVVPTPSDDKVTICKLLDHLKSIFIILDFFFFTSFFDMERDCVLEYFVFWCLFKGQTWFNQIRAFRLDVNWVVLLHRNLVWSQLDFTHSHQVEQLSDFCDGGQITLTIFSWLYLIFFLAILNRRLSLCSKNLDFLIDILLQIIVKDILVILDFRIHILQL